MALSGYVPTPAAAAAPWAAKPAWAGEAAVGPGVALTLPLPPQPIHGAAAAIGAPTIASGHLAYLAPMALAVGLGARQARQHRAAAGGKRVRRLVMMVEHEQDILKPAVDSPADEDKQVSGVQGQLQELRMRAAATQEAAAAQRHAAKQALSQLESRLQQQKEVAEQRLAETLKDIEQIGGQLVQLQEQVKEEGLARRTHEQRVKRLESQLKMAAEGAALLQVVLVSRDGVLQHRDGQIERLNGALKAADMSITDLSQQVVRNKLTIAEQQHWLKMDRKDAKERETKVAELQRAYSDASDKLELAQDLQMQTYKERDQLSRKVQDTEGKISRLETLLVHCTSRLEAAEEFVALRKLLLSKPSVA